MVTQRSMDKALRNSHQPLQPGPCPYICALTKTHDCWREICILLHFLANSTFWLVVWVEKQAKWGERFFRLRAGEENSELLGMDPLGWRLIPTSAATGKRQGPLLVLAEEQRQCQSQGREKNWNFAGLVSEVGINLNPDYYKVINF